MRTAGIDIGSRTVKVAILENRQVLEWRVAENSHDPLEVADSTLREVSYDRVVATGYGRHLFARHRPCPVITEIRAVAAGVRLVFPYCRTVLDIGGQDTKALALGIGGGISKFEMNDRCAAGTGRSLEMMATALSYRLTEFVAEALIATKACQINSLCAVFGQSEVVSLLAKGTPREAVALAVHQAVARRAISLVNRVGVGEDLVFVGGAALNSCLRREIEILAGVTVLTPENPQIVAAIGCGLVAESGDVRAREDEKEQPDANYGGE